MLELIGVRKRYGSFEAVKGIDLKVHRGEIFGFLGPNGAGKTTTIRMIAGVLRPTAGRVIVGGDDLAQDPESAKARVGYIPDRPYLYEKLSGGEFLRFVAGLWGREGADVEARADRLL
ncbi:MAG: ABC transporter ATP-binding protein, partial [Gemmatimonadetes bacterium]|nr:ABC transporter ATP-binding protein [Gemmatimonadota bacterium]